MTEKEFKRWDKISTIIVVTIFIGIIILINTN